MTMNNLERRRKILKAGFGYDAETGEILSLLQLQERRRVRRAKEKLPKQLTRILNATLGADTPAAVDEIIDLLKTRLRQVDASA
jgi:hypothetical protein